MSRCRTTRARDGHPRDRDPARTQLRPRAIGDPVASRGVGANDRRSLRGARGPRDRPTVLSACAGRPRRAVPAHPAARACGSPVRGALRSLRMQGARPRGGARRRVHLRAAVHGPALHRGRALAGVASGRGRHGSRGDLDRRAVMELSDRRRAGRARTPTAADRGSRRSLCPAARARHPARGRSDAPVAHERLCTARVVQRSAMRACRHRRRATRCGAGSGRDRAPALAFGPRHRCDTHPARRRAGRAIATAGIRGSVPDVRPRRARAVSVGSRRASRHRLGAARDRCLRDGRAARRGDRGVPRPSAIHDRARRAGRCRRSRRARRPRPRGARASRS